MRTTTGTWASANDVPARVEPRHPITPTSKGLLFNPDLDMARRAKPLLDS